MVFMRIIILSVAICLLNAGANAEATTAPKHKVLVVMSYEEMNPWCIEIKEGIESVLGGHSEINYFYMDTKKNIKGGPQKAAEAFAVYQMFNPDGVITADDNAQSMFVIPYLKDNVSTPVMFCGVNAEPQEYGYPTPFISGILERAHINESIALAKQLDPSIRTIGFLAKDSPSGRAILKQVVNESDSYLVDFIGFKLPKTVKETLGFVAEFKKICDLLFVGATNGILDDNGKPLNNKQVTQIVSEAFGKPLIGSNRFHVEFGALCAVVKTGQEQGRTAAKMLLTAMNGADVSQMPITINYNGSRVINVTVMDTLNIKPKPIILLGTELVKTKD